MRKLLYLSSKNLKIGALKWIAILSIKGLTWAAKKENFVTILDIGPLNLNPEYDSLPFPFSVYGIDLHTQFAVTILLTSVCSTFEFIRVNKVKTSIEFLTVFNFFTTRA